MPNLETMQLGEQNDLSSLEQDLLEKVKRARPNLGVEFSEYYLLEDKFDVDDFVFDKIADLVWKRYDY